MASAGNNALNSKWEQAQLTTNERASEGVENEEEDATSEWMNYMANPRDVKEILPHTPTIDVNAS